MGEYLDVQLNYHRLLSTTIDLGVLLLVNGAEIYRVEESMQRILKAYGIESTDVFAIPNLIILSMETADKETVTKTRRVYARGTNYRIVCEVNDYVRYICAQKPPLAEVRQHTQEIRRGPVYGFPTQLFAAALIGFFFTLFFDGTLKDAVVAMSAVALAKALCMQMERFQHFFCHPGSESDSHNGSNRLFFIYAGPSPGTDDYWHPDDIGSRYCLYNSYS